jgi:hypothetical protein
MAIDLNQRRTRCWFGAMSLASTGLLYAEGVLKSGWFEVALLLPILFFILSRKPLAFVLPALMAIMAVSLTLVIGDIALRPLLEGRLDYTALNVYSHSHPPLPIVARWDSHRDVVEEVYGDLAAVHGNPALQERRRIVFRTDEAGFRNEKVPDQIDLIALGDSNTAGWGTSQESIFSELLQRQGIRTYNLGYPGGPYDEYINFAIEWPRLKVKPQALLVWTLYVGNDLDDEGGKVWELDKLPWQTSFKQWLVRCRTYRNRSPLNRLINNILTRSSHRLSKGITIRNLPDGKAMLFLDTHEVWSRKPQSVVEGHPNFAKLKRTFAAMRELTQKRDVQVIVLILPTKGDLYRWIVESRTTVPEDRAPTGVAEAMRGACEQAGFRCIDMKPYLYDVALRLYQSSGKLLWWPDDTHIGEDGHEAIARLVMDLYKSTLHLTDSESSPGLGR